MKLRSSRLPVCFVSGKPVKGGYYDTPDGPVLVDSYAEYKRSRQQGA